MNHGECYNVLKIVFLGHPVYNQCTYLDSVHIQLDSVHIQIVYIFRQCTYLDNVHIQIVYIYSQCTYLDSLHIQLVYIFRQFTYLDSVHIQIVCIFRLVHQLCTEPKLSVVIKRFETFQAWFTPMQLYQNTLNLYCVLY